MTDELCSVCGDTLDVEWVETTRMDDSRPTYLLGRVECPNRCDPRLLTRDDGPVYDATGQCVHLGLAAEIKRITGDRDATLQSVINDPDVERRVETLRRLRLVLPSLPRVTPRPPYLRRHSPRKHSEPTGRVEGSDQPGGLGPGT